jgi:putative membrane protein
VRHLPHLTFQHPFQHLFHDQPGGTLNGHGQGDPGDLALQMAVLLVWLALAVAYVLAGRVAVLRGRTQWPARRTAAWLGGAALGLAVTVGPIATAAEDSFATHTAVHLVLGMLVPLLLVLGAPVSLFLRAVPVSTGRRYSRIVRHGLLQLLAHPVVALLLTSVPLILLYGNPDALPLLHHPLLGPLIHVHFVAAGVLFTYAVVGPDPHPRRAPAGLRVAVIIASIAVHGVVSKYLFSTAGQAGTPPDAEQAALLMYYGGDAVHVLLLVVFCAEIYRRTGPRPVRLHRVAEAEGTPGQVV